MAYTIQAVITLAGDSIGSLPEPLRWLPLPASLLMLPLGTDALEVLGLPRRPFTFEEETETPPSLGKFCERLSQGRSIVYIEAEIFGGWGTQASILFKDGVQVGDPVIAEDAINQALRSLGVASGNAVDEFEAAGLGRHRNTDGWLE
ncbi:hypothetical protein FMZ60_01455 [Alcaligenaceae bacterium SJ-26]|nr:hypothetical protein FMZ60_01455 [Alcaligenaceae bacterium SJ-26]